jgi:hypothetical protein
MPEGVGTAGAGCWEFQCHMAELPDDASQNKHRPDGPPCRRERGVRPPSQARCSSWGPGPGAGVCCCLLRTEQRKRRKRHGAGRNCNCPGRDFLPNGGGHGVRRRIRCAAGGGACTSGPRNGGCESQTGSGPDGYCRRRAATGLGADAVEAAVRAGESCVVAQLRKGSVVVSALPALADGGCLIGATG